MMMYWFASLWNSQHSRIQLQGQVQNLNDNNEEADQDYLN